MSIVPSQPTLVSELFMMTGRTYVPCHIPMEYLYNLSIERPYDSLSNCHLAPTCGTDSGKANCVPALRVPENVCDYRSAVENRRRVSGYYL